MTLHRATFNRGDNIAATIKRATLNRATLHRAYE